MRRLLFALVLLAAPACHLPNTPIWCRQEGSEDGYEMNRDEADFHENVRGWICDRSEYEADARWLEEQHGE